MNIKTPHSSNNYKFLMSMLLLIVTPKINAQTFENIRAEVNGEVIEIVYDLKGPTKGFKVDVKVLSSHNDFAKSLSNVSGDILNVTPGTNKKINWTYGDELNNFKGELSFELEGEIIYDYSITKPTTNATIRRGKPYDLAWTGGLPSDLVNIELIDPDGKIVWNQQVKNDGTLTWSPENKIKSGKNYSMTISSNGEIAKVESLKIRPKIPRWIYGIPILVGGTIAIIISSQPTALPEAPDPPGGN